MLQNFSDILRNPNDSVHYAFDRHPRISETVIPVSCGLISCEILVTTRSNQKELDRERRVLEKQEWEVGCDWITEFRYLDLTCTAEDRDEDVIDEFDDDDDFEDIAMTRILGQVPLMCSKPISKGEVECVDLSSDDDDVIVIPSSYPLQSSNIRQPFKPEQSQSNYAINLNQPRNQPAQQSNSFNVIVGSRPLTQTQSSKVEPAIASSNLVRNLSSSIRSESDEWDEFDDDTMDALCSKID
jgi:hypothetical protein